MRRGGTVVLAAMALFVAATPAKAAISNPTATANPGAGTQSGATAVCGSKAVVGGGVTINGGFASGFVNSSFPADGPDSNVKPDDAWVAYADAFDDVQMTTVGICASGVSTKVVEASRIVSPDQTKSDTAKCPGGWRVSSGGVRVSGSYGVGQMVGSIPAKNNRGWVGKVQSFSDNDATMTTYAICVRGDFADRLKTVRKKATVKSGETKFSAEMCAKGSRIVGGGTLVKSASALLSSTNPSGARAWISVADSIGPDYSMETYAICLK